MNREFKISLSQECYSDVIYLSQYDDDYSIVLTVLNKYSLADISGYSYQLEGTRPDGLGFTFPCTVSGSKVTIPIDTTLTACAGASVAELVIYDGNGFRFGSANVQIIVEPAAHPDSVIDADEDTIRGLAAEVQEIVDTAKDEVEAALVDVQTDIDDLKEDLNDIEDRVEALEQGSGGTGGVSTSVRQALLTLLKSAAYTETGLSDEIATIESWVTETTALSVSPSTASISGSGTQQLTATTTPAGGTVTWSSSNTAVATVSSSGLVTGVSNGTATITASCGDKTASCTVTVSGFATLVSIDATYTQTGTVTPEDSLSSLTSDLVVVATYDNSDTVTLTSDQYTLSGTLTVGTSTITVSYGGKTTTFTVTVTSAVTEELWINDLGNTGSTASFSFAPFAYPSDVYAYDYTKQITAIEGDFTNSGSITVGYYSGDITQGVAYDSSKFTAHEVLSVSATGVNKLELTEPLQIPSDAVLAIGRQYNDGATFKYGGTKTKGFVYKDTAGGANKWKDQNKTLGLNIYRI